MSGNFSKGFYSAGSQIPSTNPSVYSSVYEPHAQVNQINLTSGQIGEYEARINALSVQLSQARQKNMDLLEKNREVMEVMNTLKVGVETLQSENAALQTENKKLKKRITQTVNEKQKETPPTMETSTQTIVVNESWRNFVTSAKPSEATYETQTENDPDIIIEKVVTKGAAKESQENSPPPTQPATKKRSHEKNQVLNKIQSKVPPPTYTCNFCGTPGDHWFRECPAKGIKRSTGIPNDQLAVTTKDDPRAMLHPSGKYVVQIMHHEAASKSNM
ncbi:zinc knuckle domain-containing protein [Ditylenchus destructor]|uniref:Zinc knuckle domain-containing protein n=1 Tax=Ditylenchus destructor TaxID=166010 RepID=A0AAD4QXS6_9BILA|nr:zinc knuckle domain-containing protein [Ditylenchus destructor]